MPMTPKEMIAFLKKNGFIEIRRNGSHRFFANATTNKTTVVPVHSKELKKGTENIILKQAGLK